MVVKETSYVDITYNTVADILLINWKCGPTIRQLQESYLAALEFVQQNNAITAFCTDLSVIGPLNREQEAWLMLEFYPKVYQIIRQSINAAVVFSEEHFKAIVTNYQKPAYQPNQEFINFNYFTSFKEAMHWLMYLKKGQDAVSVVLS